MFYIQDMNLSSIDLNLLVALEALLEERSVTLAARRVGLSQPAMSNALARLRSLLGDDLLRRNGARMVLTARGAQLAPLVSTAIAGIRRVLASEPEFNPALATVEFKLGISDYAELLLMPELASRISRQAPGVVLRALRLENLFIAPETELMERRFDVALGFFGTTPAPHSGVLSQVLWRDRNVCVSSIEHPRLKQADLTPEQFLNEQHVAVFYRNQSPGLMDAVLASRGQSRRVALYTPHFVSALAVVAATEMLCIAPARLAALFSRVLPICLRPMPIEFPEFEFSMIWRQSRHLEDDLAWLRSQISQSITRQTVPKVPNAMDP